GEDLVGFVLVFRHGDFRLRCRLLASTGQDGEEKAETKKAAPKKKAAAKAEAADAGEGEEAATKKKDAPKKKAAEESAE
ncbi:hypothetical protein ACC698_37480, partial [Rhizobium johnstonii]